MTTGRINQIVRFVSGDFSLVFPSQREKNKKDRLQKPFPKVHFWFGFFFFLREGKATFKKGPFQSEKRPKSGSI